MLAIESEHPMSKEERVPKVEPTTSQRTLTRSSAVSQKSVEIMVPESSNNPLHRSKLAPSRSSSETQSSGKKLLNLRKTKNSSIESTMSLPNQKSLEKKHNSLRHQKAIVTQSDVTLSTQPSITDDRKALREALYQENYVRGGVSRAGSRYQSPDVSRAGSRYQSPDVSRAGSRPQSPDVSRAGSRPQSPDDVARTRGQNKTDLDF